MYLEAKTFLYGLLTIEDKLSMAHGLESRVPFSDNDLVNFSMRIPISMKLGMNIKAEGFDENQPGPKQKQYFHQTRNGKLLFKKALSRHVPDSISNGDRQGFSGPDGSWFRGDSIDLVQRIIFDDGAPIFNFLDVEGIRVLVDQHLTGKKTRRLLIWSLLCANYLLETPLGCGWSLS